MPNDLITISDFVVLEEALLEEFKTYIMPHLPEGMLILRRGWEDLFAFFKAAQATNMPEYTMKRQLQKMIGGWFAEGGMAKAPGQEDD